MTQEERRNTLMAMLIGIILALSLIGLNNPFIFDSVGKIASNPEIRDLSQIGKTLIYPYKGTAVLNRNDPSRPVVFLTYAFNYYWGQLNPFGYHLFDVITHGLTVTLIFLLVLIITQRLFNEENELLAIITALYFALHPLLFGTVIYTYGRSDTLSTLFIFLALYYFIKDFKPSSLSLFITSSFYFLGLYTKQSVIVFPLLLILFDYTIHSSFDPQFIKQRYKFYIPIWGITLFYLLHRTLYFGGLGDLEAQLGGTWDRFDYLFIQPAIFFKYLYLFLNPTGMALDHYITSDSVLFPLKFLGIVGVTGIGVAIYFLWKKNIPHKRLYLFGIGFYLLFLLPTSSIMPTVDAMVDRRVYTASFGLFLPLIFFMAHQFSIRWVRIEEWGKREQIFFTFIFIHLLLLSGYTFYRNKMFNKPEDVWASIIKIYPESKRAINNLGLRYLKMGEYEKAMEQFHKLMRIHPDDHFPHMNIARIYADKNNPYYDKTKAEEHFKKALELLPQYAFTHFLYGEFLFHHNRLDEAEKELLASLNLNPNIGGTNKYLGMIYEKRGDSKTAQQFFQEAARESGQNSEQVVANQTIPVPSTSEMSGEKREIPVEQVNPEIIINLYKNAIEKEPQNKQLKEKFKEYCLKMKLNCAKDY